MDAAGDRPASWVHPTAVVDDGAILGAGCKVWHFSHVMAGARVGAGTSIGQGCFIAGRAVVGGGVKLQNNVSVFDGVVLEDDVFCGPSVTFTNVHNPRAHVPRKTEFRETLVRRGASIGANATVLPGIVVGQYAFVGAGATVTRDVPAFALVVGVPARRVGWMGRYGERLVFDAEGRARCAATGDRYVEKNGAVTLVESEVP